MKPGEGAQFIDCGILHEAIHTTYATLLRKIRRFRSFNMNMKKNCARNNHQFDKINVVDEDIDIKI